MSDVWTYVPPATGFGPIDHGDDQIQVTNQDVGPEDGGASVILEHAIGKMYLWVTEWTVDYALGGTKAQSRLYREFFGKQVVQPVLTLTGQHGNSFQAQRLAEYARATQMSIVSLDGPADPTVTLTILGGGPVVPPMASTKGFHPDVVINGFILNAERGAKRFDYAPEFQLKFAVAYSQSPLFVANKAYGQKLISIGEFLTKPSLFSYAVNNGGQPQVVSTVQTPFSGTLF